MNTEERDRFLEMGKDYLILDKELTVMFDTMSQKVKRMQNIRDVMERMVSEDSK